MDFQETDTCRSCGKHIDGNYCGECGEEKFHSLRLKEILPKILVETFSVKSRLWTTFLGLIWRPGKLAREYVLGVRKKYVNPIRYYLVFLTLYLLFFYSLNDGFQAYYDLPLFKYLEPGHFDANSVRMMEKVKNYQQVLYQYLVFLQIPTLTLLTYIFFRKAKFTVAEHTAINLFVLSQGLILGIFAFVIAWKFPLFSLLFDIVAVWIYIAWLYRGVFEQSWTKTLFKTFLITILNLVLFGLLIGVISSICVLSTAL